MSEDLSTPKPVSPTVEEVWAPDRLWFRPLIPDDLPWGDETLLPEIPDEAQERFGLITDGYVEVEGERLEPGSPVFTDDARALNELLGSQGIAPRSVFVPWYGRLIPPAWWRPYFQRIDLARYRAALRPQLGRALLFTILPVVVGFSMPQFLMIALLFATFYGLFPLVQNVMAWFQRVDRQSVEELNRHLVADTLFSRWISGRPAGPLAAGIVVLALVFLGQMATGLTTSIERAALVKSAVLEGGEWWRTITTGLMHGSVLHILFNGMALYSLGRVLVALASPALLNLVFFLTVITGSLASLWLGPGQASVGASGGILGCLGFLLVVTAKFREQLPAYLRTSLIQSTIVIAIFGLLGSAFIDNAAHAGGFLGGVGIGLLFYPRLRLAPEKTHPLLRAASLLCLLGLVAGVAKVAWELWAG